MIITIRIATITPISTYALTYFPMRFTDPIPGTITRVSFSFTKASFCTLNGSVCTIDVMPRAKNIPASVTINGWISRYATKNPCASPNASPIPRAIKSETNTFPPIKSRYTAQHMLTNATTPPTEISMLPVIMTRLSPHAVMINAPFAFKMLKNVCGFKNPPPSKIIAPIYIKKNTTIVMVSSRLVSVIFFNFLPISANLLYSLALLQLLAESGQPFSYLGST